MTKNEPPDEFDSLFTGYKNQVEIAGRDTNNLPYATRNGLEAQIRRARESLKTYRNNLISKIFPSRLAAIGAIGSDLVRQREVAELLDQNGGLVVDPLSFYRLIAQVVEPSFGKDSGRRFLTAQWSLVIGQLRNHAIDLGIDEFDYEFNSKAPRLGTIDEVVSFLRSDIERQCGHTFNRMFIERQILNTIIENDLIAKTLPVFILEWKEEFHYLTSLFTRFKTYEFDDTFEVTIETVTKLFKKPSTKLKSKEQTETQQITEESKEINN